MQAILRIDPSDGAAAGADFDDIDNCRFNRKPFYIAIGVVNGIDRKAAVFNQSAFGSGAAHIEGDDIVEAQLLRIGAGADATADGTGFYQADGLAAGAFGRQQSAIGAHHEERAVEALTFEILIELSDVTADLRSDIGVGGDRRTALVLVPLACQISAEGHVSVRQEFFQLRGCGFLMRRIDIRVHEEDRQRLDIERLDFGGKFLQRL